MKSLRGLGHSQLIKDFDQILAKFQDLMKTLYSAKNGSKPFLVLRFDQNFIKS